MIFCPFFFGLCRIGSLVIRGTLNTVNATSDSIASMYLSGVQTSAEMHLSSTADAYVEQVSDYFEPLRSFTKKKMILADL